MNSRQRRVRAIELSLTPQEIVVVWLRNALQAGTFEEVATHLPPNRGTVANAVYDTVRSSMKSQPDPLVERAILQARREADSLYLLVGNANIAVLEGRAERELECTILLAYLRAEMRGNATKERVQSLHPGVMRFLQRVIVLEAATTQVSAERLNGQPVLFSDSAAKVEEQLQMAERLSDQFNSLARAVDVAEINLEDLRNSLQAETDLQVSIWVNQARIEMLSTFGTEKEMHAAIEQSLLLLKSNSG
jgi:hypothetical protein